jgi:hypothetical protein
MQTTTCSEHPDPAAAEAAACEVCQRRIATEGAAQAGQRPIALSEVSAPSPCPTHQRAWEPTCAECVASRCNSGTYTPQDVDAAVEAKLLTEERAGEAKENYIARVRQVAQGVLLPGPKIKAEMEILVDVPEVPGSIARVRHRLLAVLPAAKLSVIESKAYLSKAPRVILRAVCQGAPANLAPYVLTFALSLLREEKGVFVGSRELFSNPATLIYECNSVADLLEWCDHYLRTVEREGQNNPKVRSMARGTSASGGGNDTPSLRRERRTIVRQRRVSD